MNLHLLRLFAEVARQGSFSRAAEALHVSQPAVSKGVRLFEAQIGSRLLSNQCRCALQAVSSGGWLSQTVCCTGIKHHGKRRRRKEWLPGACLKPQQALP